MLSTCCPMSLNSSSYLRGRVRFVLHIICIIISLSCFLSTFCPVVFVVIAPVTLFRVPTQTGTVAGTETGPAPSILWPSLNARPGALRVLRVGKFIQFSILILLVFPRRVSRCLADRRLNCSVSSASPLVIYCCIFGRLRNGFIYHIVLGLFSMLFLCFVALTNLLRIMS